MFSHVRFFSTGFIIRKQQVTAADQRNVGHLHKAVDRARCNSPLERDFKARYFDGNKTRLPVARRSPQRQAFE